MTRVSWHSVALHRDVCAFMAGGFLMGLLVALSTGQWWSAALAGLALYAFGGAWRYYRRSDMRVIMPAAGLAEDTFVAFGTRDDPDPRHFRRNQAAIEFSAAVVFLLAIVASL